MVVNISGVLTTTKPVEGLRPTKIINISNMTGVYDVAYRAFFQEPSQEILLEQRGRGMDTSTICDRDFESVSARRIHLNITEFNSHSVSIQISNKSCKSQCLFILRMIPVLIFIFACSKYVIGSNFVVGVGSFLSIIFILYRILKIVKTDKLAFISEFGLQLSTEGILGNRTSQLISSSCIHDFAITEAIQDLSIKYFLIVRTKGSLYEEEPIIPIFTSLDPTVDCLEVIYKNLQQKLEIIE